MEVHHNNNTFGESYLNGTLFGNISIASLDSSHNNKTGKGTMPIYPQSISKYVIGFYTSFLLLAFLIVIANSTVLTIYFRTRTLRTRNNRLLISLACTDLFAGLLNIPLLALSAFMMALGRNIVALFFTVNVMSDFIVIVNELNLFLIFFDRYIVICHPLSSRKVITESMRVNSISATWVIAGVVAILPLSWCYKVVAGQLSSAAYRKTMFELITLHSIFVMCCCFIVPSVVMLFFLASMIRSLNVQKRKRKQRLKIRKDDCKFRAYHKAFVMLSAMYVLMLVAWSPLMIVRLCLDLKVNVAMSAKALNFLMMLRFFTALVNPFIYTFIKPEFRKAIFQQLARDRSRGSSGML